MPGVSAAHRSHRGPKVLNACRCVTVGLTAQAATWTVGRFTYPRRTGFGALASESDRSSYGTAPGRMLLSSSAPSNSASAASSISSCRILACSASAPPAVGWRAASECIRWLLPPRGSRPFRNDGAARTPTSPSSLAESNETLGAPCLERDAEALFALLRSLPFVRSRRAPVPVSVPLSEAAPLKSKFQSASSASVTYAAPTRTRAREHRLGVGWMAHAESVCIVHAAEDGGSGGQAGELPHQLVVGHLHQACRTRSRLRSAAHPSAVGLRNAQSTVGPPWLPCTTRYRQCHAGKYRALLP